MISPQQHEARSYFNRINMHLKNIKPLDSWSRSIADPNSSPERMAIDMANLASAKFDLPKDRFSTKRMTATNLYNYALLFFPLRTFPILSPEEKEKFKDEFYKKYKEEEKAARLKDKDEPMNLVFMYEILDRMTKRENEILDQRKQLLTGKEGLEALEKNYQTQVKTIPNPVVTAKEAAEARKTCLKHLENLKKLLPASEISKFQGYINSIQGKNIDDLVQITRVIDTKFYSSIHPQTKQQSLARAGFSAGAEKEFDTISQNFENHFQLAPDLQTEDFLSRLDKVMRESKKLSESAEMTNAPGIHPEFGRKKPTYPVTAPTHTATAEPSPEPNQTHQKPKAKR